MMQPPRCPVCDGRLTLAGEPIADELIACDECNSELVVVATAPLRFEEAPMVEEDWGE